MRKTNQALLTPKEKREKDKILLDIIRAIAKNHTSYIQTFLNWARIPSALAAGFSFLILTNLGLNYLLPTKDYSSAPNDAYNTEIIATKSFLSSLSTSIGFSSVNAIFDIWQKKLLIALLDNEIVTLQELHAYLQNIPDAKKYFPTVSSLKTSLIQTDHRIFRRAIISYGIAALPFTGLGLTVEMGAPLLEKATGIPAVVTNSAASVVAIQCLHIGSHIAGKVDGPDMAFYTPESNLIYSTGEVAATVASSLSGIPGLMPAAAPVAALAMKTFLKSISWIRKTCCLTTRIAAAPIEESRITIES